MSQKLVLRLIGFYQKHLSLDQGWARVSFLTDRACRFTPTCSQYTYEAVEKYGVGKGLWLGLKRVLRCHPWSPGGYDPVK
ncbi:membrane protein insertion efficiency factor YidD [Candidatus Parcubacteria bacterium]|nr:membrane protein insertion efficiency factor YidD [Candidatus Parcubacteria bacterium]